MTESPHRPPQLLPSLPRSPRPKLPLNSEAFPAPLLEVETLAVDEATNRREVEGPRTASQGTTARPAVTVLPKASRPRVVSMASEFVRVLVYVL